MDREELKELIHETLSMVLDERNRVDAEKHAADHIFIEMLRQKEQRKQEIWISVKKNVLVFVIISALGGFGTLVWNGWMSANDKPTNGKPPSINGGVP